MLQESLVYKMIYCILSYFASIWQNSLTAHLLNKTGTALKAAFSGSKIVNLFKREGLITRSYNNSLLYNLVDGLLSLPQRTLHPFYKKAEPVFMESFSFKALTFLLKKLHLLIAAFLFIALIIKDTSWYNIYSTAAVIAILIMFFIRTILEGRTGFKAAALNVFLILFAVCIILAEMFSIMPGASLRFLVFHFTCFLLVVLLVSTIRTGKDMSELLAIVLTGVTIAGLYGIYQYFAGIPVNVAWIDPTVNQGNMTRVYSFFANPNNFAEIIILFMPFYFAAFFNTKKPCKKLIYIAMAVPPFAALLMTLSRSAWLAFAMAALVYVWFKEKKLLLLFLLLGISALPFLPPSILLRIKTMVNPFDSSLSTRTSIYKTISPILKDFWFTGLGLGNETLLRVSRNYSSYMPKGSIPSHTHNLYLQIWIETGIPGIIAFLAFIFSTVKKTVQYVISSSKDHYINNILISCLSSLVAILAMGMVEYVWFYPRVMLFFWVVIGITLAALHIGKNVCEKGLNHEGIDHNPSL